MKDEVEKLLWNAISGAVTASINTAGDTTKISENIHEEALLELLAIISKAEKKAYDEGYMNGSLQDELNV